MNGNLKRTLSKELGFTVTPFSQSFASRSSVLSFKHEGATCKKTKSWDTFMVYVPFSSLPLCPLPKTREQKPPYKQRGKQNEQSSDEFSLEFKGFFSCNNLVGNLQLEQPAGNCAELPVGSWMGMGIGLGMR